jgi:hypothetical protein
MTTPLENVATVVVGSTPFKKAFEKPPTKSFKPLPLVKASD